MLDIESLTLASWNADGLEKKGYELRCFLSDHDIDILLIQETFLKPSHKFKIPNYLLYRDDRLGRQKGGTAIAIKKNINHYHLAIDNLTSIEATGVVILGRDSNLLLVSCYKPPTNRFIPADFDILFSKNIPTLLVGDFNCKSPGWNSRCYNREGRDLENYTITKNDIIIHPPDSHTRFAPNQLSDVLDIGISRNLGFSVSVEVYNELSSDHLPLIIKLQSFNWAPIHTQGRIIWSKLQANLNNIDIQIPIISNKVDLNMATENFQTLTSEIIENSRAPHQVSFKGHIPQDIKDLIKRKNKVRKLYYRSHYPPYKEEFTELQNQVKTKLREHHNNAWQNKLLQLNPEDGGLWKISKFFRTDSSTYPPLSTPLGIVCSDAEKAEAFADNLETECRNNDNDEDMDVTDSINRQSTRFLIYSQIDPDNIAFTTPDEIQTLILKSTNSAPGYDKISFQVVKYFNKKFIMTLVSLFNAALRIGHFPAPWKHAHVTMIPKVGKNRKFVQNYRPISLLPVLGKLFERIILARIKNHINEHSIIPDHQFGFKAAHNTTLQLARTTEYIYDSFTKNRYAGAIFLDVERAFDRVWHNGLIFKLIKLKFPTYIIKAVNSFLRCRTFQIKINNTTSSSRSLRAGVPQGSVLAPTLYNIFTYDLPTPDNCCVATYADDTAIIAPSYALKQLQKYLQSAIDELSTWFNKWRIKINPTKCNTIIFHRTRKHHLPENITLDDYDIPNVDEVKYLGVLLDQNLKFSSHIAYTHRKANLALHKLFPLLCRKSRLDLKNKLLIYKQIIEPIILYAAPIWANAASSQIHKLQTTQNKTIRMAVDAYMYTKNDCIYRDLKLVKISDKIEASKTVLLNKMISHSNPLVRKAVDYPPELNGSVKRLRVT